VGAECGHEPRVVQSERAPRGSAVPIDHPDLGGRSGNVHHARHCMPPEGEVGPGDAYVIEPGHDAWVVGDESFVGFEFEARSAEEYARS
jgi:hypothetical protein